MPLGMETPIQVVANSDNVVLLQIPRNLLKNIKSRPTLADCLRELILCNLVKNIRGKHSITQRIVSEQEVCFLWHLA